MPRRDLSTRDISEHATSELEYVLDEEKKSREPVVPRVTAEEAMTHKRVYQADSSRDVTRVLFISTDTALLNPTTQSLDGYVNLSDLFDEVHILILRRGITSTNPVLRVGTNVWMYTASARYWWLLPAAGKKVIEDQLVFASGFRPDLIVARDPFESALVALSIGKKYKRPTQLHVLEDFTTKSFLKKHHSNFWRRFIPRFTVTKFLSIRTATDLIEDMLHKYFKAPDINTLPRLHSYESLISAPVTLDLKEKYRPFTFIILFIGKLSHQSTLFRAIDATRFVLRNPRVGLVVLGDGPARLEFQKRTEILGIKEQVVFETRESDIVPYIKSANLLVVTDTDADSEEIVLQGAAAGIPMVMAETERRADVFIDGQSTYLCEPTDTQVFADRINELLNNIGTRRLFTETAQAMISLKFHQDPEEYREAYRMSIEQALFVEPAKASKVPKKSKANK
ncbi:MAG: glycosyltransferase [Patescibacteria group bacterium]